MPYVPTTEKLSKLGFSQIPAVYTNETRYSCYQDAVDAPGLEWFVSIYVDGTIHLADGGGWVSSEHGDLVFVGECPSEEFFDQLVTAVGW